MQNAVLTVVIKRETDKAYQVDGRFDAPNENYGLECWVPKSICWVENRIQAETFNGQKLDMCEMSIPTWFTRKDSVKVHDPKAHYAK